MSNFLKKTKRSWEENEHDARRRQYPLTPQDAYFHPPQAMFNPKDLVEAYEYYTNRIPVHLWNLNKFFDYLYELEKYVPLEKQKRQP